MSGAARVVLVIGEGAEDAEDALGDLIASTTAAVVIGFDPVAARTTTTGHRPPHVAAWLTAEYHPDLTLVVGDGETPTPLLVQPTASTFSVTRLAALTVLSSLHDAPEGTSEGPTGLAAPSGEAVASAEATAVLTQWRDGPHVPRLQVADRGPRVSMLVTVYNQERFLRATLDSALADTYDDYEVVVLDDGSTDASPSIIDQYAGDPRLVVVRQENLGGTGRMDLVINRGLRAARGELIAMMGGDDVSLPHRLTAQVAAFDEDPGLGVCHSGGHMIDASGQRFSGFSLPLPYDEFSFLRDMQRVNLVSHPTVMHHRSSLETVGWYEEGVACDYHWWMKAGGRTRFRYLPQRLVEYRIHDRSLSTTAEGRDRCGLEAVRHRRLIAQRRTLEDYFPELRDRREPWVWHDAALELGNRVVNVDPALAVHFYRLGFEARASHRINYNLAAASYLTGATEEALAAAELAAKGSTRGSELRDALGRGDVTNVDLFAPGVDFASALAAARLAPSSSARMWDGSPVGTASAYVSLPAGMDSHNRQVLEAWSQHTRSGGRRRWVYPDLGHGAHAVLTQLADAAVFAGDLSAAGEIVIESVEDFALLPADSGRPTGPLSSPAELTAFTGWMKATR